MLYNYFKQLFAQVTNPPLDAIREEIITSMITTIGSEGNLLDETPEQCRLLRLEQPILTNHDLAQIKAARSRPAAAAARSRRSSRGPTAPTACGSGWTSCAREASQAIAEGVTILILSDRGVNHEHGADSRAAGHQRRAPSPGPRRAPARAAASSSRPAKPARCSTSPC